MPFGYARDVRVRQPLSGSVAPVGRWQVWMPGVSMGWSKSGQALQADSRAIRVTEGIVGDYNYHYIGPPTLDFRNAATGSFIIVFRPSTYWGGMPFSQQLWWSYDTHGFGTYGGQLNFQWGANRYNITNIQGDQTGKWLIAAITRTATPQTRCAWQIAGQRGLDTNSHTEWFNQASFTGDNQEPMLINGDSGGGATPSNVNGDVAMIAYAPYLVLSDAELIALRENPWSIFPGEMPFYYGTTVGGAQLLRPSSDITSGWQSSTGGAHYAVVDEASADDGDYLYTEDLGAIDEVAVAVGTDPSSSTGHVLRYRARSDYAQSVLISLYQGTTLIAQWTDALTAGFAPYEHTLSGTEADSITDYTALRVRLTSLS